MLGAGQPSEIGRYRILRVLGRGAMGVVYEAHDPALARDIALKVIQPFAMADESRREEFEKRFLAEARIAGRLSHSGIVVVHDVGRDEASGALYIALERLQGRTLAEMAAGRSLEWREAVRITASVARALAHAHAQGVVHRDMKPANVMVLASGETKLMDFGIASLESVRMHFTGPGDFLGTPLYMAPEQALDGAIDARTDIFQLGEVFYTLLTGRAPFEAGNLAGIVARVIKGDPAPPSHLVDGIPEEVDRIVARAMAKEPKDRYPDADAFAAALEGALLPAAGKGEVELVLAEEPAPARPSTSTLPEAPVVGGRVGVSAALLLVALGLAVGVAWWREKFQAPAVPALQPSVAAPSPTPAPPRTAPPPRPSHDVAAAPGLLAVDFEHPFASGVLRVWVDDGLVLEEKVGSRVDKKAMVFKMRKGELNEVLEVNPGPHRLRVQVEWDGGHKTERISGNFRSGLIRRLEVRVGRLRKNLSLEWK